MIKGIGVDAVEVKRFSEWSLKPKNELSKIFTKKEIAYCLKDPVKSAERFAARFAAKEACLKALQHLTPDKRLSFLSCAQEIEVEKNPSGLPSLFFSGSLSHLNNFKWLCSLTHTENTAVAFVSFY